LGCCHSARWYLQSSGHRFVAICAQGRVMLARV
jgi:hypothetical protein